MSLRSHCFFREREHLPLPTQEMENPMLQKIKPTVWTWACIALLAGPALNAQIERPKVADVSSRGVQGFNARMFWGTLFPY